MRREMGVRLTEDTLQQDKAARRIYRDTNNTHNPMHTVSRRPPKQKQAHRRPHAGENSRHQPMFLRPQSSLHDIGNEVPLQVAEVYGHGNEAPHDNAREHNARFADVEAVDARVHEREDFKEGIINPIRQRRVQIDKQNRGILETDLDRLDDGVQQHGAECNALAVHLRLRPDARVPRAFAQARRAVQ